MKAAIVSALNRFPRLKRTLRKIFKSENADASISSQYISLQADVADTEGRRLRAAWQNDAMPRRQWELVEQQLGQYRAGARIAVFDTLVDALRELPDLAPSMTLLEIGCSSGYYSEALSIAGLQLKYSGCDYSPAFIHMAHEKYPALEFSMEDATGLRYPDRSFDIVVSGGCLLHIPEYATA